MKNLHTTDAMMYTLEVPRHHGESLFRQMWDENLKKRMDNSLIFGVDFAVRPQLDYALAYYQLDYPPGKEYNPKRPDFIIIDDIEDTKPLTRQQRRQMRKWCKHPDLLQLKQKGKKMSKKARIEKLEGELKTLRSLMLSLSDRVSTVSNVINSPTGLRHRVYKLEEDSRRTVHTLREVERTARRVETKALDAIRNAERVVKRVELNTSISLYRPGRTDMPLTYKNINDNIEAICEFLHIEFITQEAQPSKTVAVPSEKDKSPKKEGK